MSSAIVFMEGRFMPMSDAHLSITNQALNYGTGVFAGLRAYPVGSPAQLKLFRPADHFRRLLSSARLLRIDVDGEVSKLTEIAKTLLAENRLERESYLRFIAYKKAMTPGTRPGVRLSGVTSGLVALALAMPAYMPATGARCSISPWRRVPNNSLPATAKVTGLYANSALAMEGAIATGRDDAVMLDQHGFVAEATTANLFVVKDGKLYTPPKHSDILPGITRGTVIELARARAGLDPIEEPIPLSFFLDADEIFMTGTGVEVTPIIEVDGRRIGAGAPGPVTTNIMQLYRGVTYGETPEYNHWLV